MITALDSSIILDVLSADPVHGEDSRKALKSQRRAGSLIACEVVWSEVSAAFPDGEQAREVMSRLRIDFSPMTLPMALAAGQAWRAYRARGGSRVRVTSDFMIAAHAATAADLLLTRDTGIARLGMSGLRLAAPGR
jgi:predicted nucleic acid-binding protein